jgi:membrane associated rhomboid family serine protease
VWPLHFTIVMHLSVLLGATGAVWAVLNALWGLWQAQHGDMACFLTHARLIA